MLSASFTLQPIEKPHGFKGLAGFNLDPAFLCFSNRPANTAVAILKKLRLVGTKFQGMGEKSDRRRGIAHQVPTASDFEILPLPLPSVFLELLQNLLVLVTLETKRFTFICEREAYGSLAGKPAVHLHQGQDG